MNAPSEQFPFVERDPTLGSASLLPFLPLKVIAERSVEAVGLLDTGATLNVLPYPIGLQLGFEWDRQTASVQLSGNLSSVEARVVVVSAIVGQFDPVRLAFAWTKSTEIPLILGQVNFFMTFDVCFFRSRGIFEIRPNAKR